jgi:hypothetical protein
VPTAGVDEPPAIAGAAAKNRANGTSKRRFVTR